jgi:DNA-binding transcriptional LysR family regulator
MELRHIRYFIAVAEECHFGRAAERLHIAQPPLSQQIKQLEAELGVQLLHRSTRRVELTQAGERYLDRARAIVAAVDDAGREATRVAAGEVGRVSLGFVGSTTYELLPRLARVLREDFPLVELDLHGEMLTPDQVAALHAGALDLAFLRPPVRDPDLRLKVLRREPLVAVLPETHLLAGRDAVPLAGLTAEPFITYPSQHRSVTFDAVFDACLAAGFEPDVRQEVAETSTLVSFVAAGIGVALVPASVQHLRITGAVYRPLEGEPATIELAVAKRARDDSPHIARVLARAERLLGEGAGGGDGLSDGTGGPAAPA